MLQYKPFDQFAAAATGRWRNNDQAAVRLGRKGIDGIFEFGGIAIWCSDDLDAQGHRSRVDDREVDIPDDARNENERYPAGARRGLLEEFKPLPAIE